jgi:hypothetical protein
MLIDDTGLLVDQPFAHPVQGLQVELIGRLDGDEFHSWGAAPLGDRFRVAKIVLLPLATVAGSRRHRAERGYAVPLTYACWQRAPAPERSTSRRRSSISFRSAPWP